MKAQAGKEKGQAAVGERGWVSLLLSRASPRGAGREFPQDSQGRGVAPGKSPVQGNRPPQMTRLHVTPGALRPFPLVRFPITSLLESGHTEKILALTGAHYYPRPPFKVPEVKLLGAKIPGQQAMQVLGH